MTKKKQSKFCKSVHISVENHTKIKEHAEKNGLIINFVVDKILEDYFENKKDGYKIL